MAQGSPQDITNDILDKLHALEDEKNPTAFSVKQLEREIEKLKGINYPKYYFLKGAALALQWKVDEAVSSLNNSIAHERSQENLINVALTFHIMGFYQKAFDMYKEALDIPGFVIFSYFNNFIQCAFLLGKSDDLERYISSRISSCLDDDELDKLQYLKGKYTSVFNVVDRDDLACFSNIMIKSLAINKKRLNELLIDFVPEGDTKVLIKIVVKHSDLNTVKALNNTLTDLVCESSDLDLISLPVNGYFSHSIES